MEIAISLATAASVASSPGRAASIVASGMPSESKRPGNTTNGLFLSGQGISKTTYNWPALGVAPRVGMAYDLTGRQRMVVRGGAGSSLTRS